MEKKSVKKTLLALAALLALPAVASASNLVDPNLKPYKPVSGVSGNIKSIGSDSMNNTMTLWAEGFLGQYPNVQIEIEGKGSGTAPPAMISGTAHFGPMSRPMKNEEIDNFEKRYGYKPVALETSIDMLAVYVNKDNPIQCLTLQQVDAIFSKTRRGGHNQNIRTWGDLGLTGQFANMPISIYGRNSASGTYGFFKDNALFGGDYKDEVKEQPGSSSVVQGTASELGGIGYSGIGYMTADVRAVPLASTPDGKCVSATPENAYTGEYPLARFLYVYINHKPGSTIDPLRREFVRYIFSKEGQEDVVRDGYYPITQVIAKEQLGKIGVR
ncbi:MAG TPA: phosphate ABC transporter substrate-binding protein [Desulfurivibrio alkaliphilus]|uniref:Phosphate-binding protein n=1 Tax=Desulfurivibrio alkaliphilus TaxID=427923 RepID=A0A7C2XAT3_9BACT|nr:phosphate ABC transporter substrate-binding protein [Desulfurivibrio alkaliphilus]